MNTDPPCGFAAGTRIGPHGAGCSCGFPPVEVPFTPTPDTYEDVHVTLADGRSIYLPKDNMARYAPATVCAVLHRLDLIRKKARELGITGLDHLLRPVPMEDLYKSGCSITLHNAIKEQGQLLTQNEP